MRNGLLVVLLLALAMPVKAMDPISLYGEEATYTVERRGANIGTYRLRFMPWQQDGFKVDVEMQLQFSYLAVFDYEFSYLAQEYWKGRQQLERMNVRIDDDGKISEYHFRRRSDGLYRDLKDDAAAYLGRYLLTSNHWHPDLMRQDRLINTLTGSVSSLDVSLESEEMVQIGAQTMLAHRYRLGGELGNTTSWYDSNQRWLGMEFDARDGSRVRIWMSPELQGQKDSGL